MSSSLRLVLVEGKQKFIEESSETPAEREQVFEHGVQPLEAIMTENGWSNTMLVKASTVPITHKMVGEARRGRRLSRKVQLKVVEAVNLLSKEKRGGEAFLYSLRDLFTYDGK